MKKIPIGKAYDILTIWAENLEHTPIIDLMAAGGDSPWKILVSTMLSARTKDQVTAQSSRNLFEVADTPGETAKLPIEKLEKLIYPVGFFRMKAKHLRKLAQTVHENNDKVPETVEELVKLPGVGIKTASLVFIKAFDGYDVCVDTHVHRITNMWNLVKTDTPEKTREALKKVLPRKYWKNINQYLVMMGQTICRPVKQDCHLCPLKEICPAAK